MQTCAHVSASSAHQSASMIQFLPAIPPRTPSQLSASPYLRLCQPLFWRRLSPAVTGEASTTRWRVEPAQTRPRRREGDPRPLVWATPAWGMLHVPFIGLTLLHSALNPRATRYSSGHFLMRHHITVTDVYSDTIPTQNAHITR